jgi:hypothetical protein
VASPAAALTFVMLALATAGLGARALVPSVGDAMARRIARLAAVIPAPADSTGVTTDTDPVPSRAEQHPADPPDPARGDAGTRRSAAKAAPGGAIDIPADRLARHTEKQLRSLRATDAVDSDGRAIGARLYGVGALGVGLADRDVVTSIDGRATPDVTTATGAAMGAYASGEAVAHATVLRDGKTLLVTVHIPRDPPRPRGERVNQID